MKNTNEQNEKTSVTYQDVDTVTVDTNKKRRGRPRLSEEEKLRRKQERETAKKKRDLVKSDVDASLVDLGDPLGFSGFGDFPGSDPVDIAITNVTQSDKDAASLIMERNAKIAIEPIVKLSRAQKSEVAKFTKAEATVLVNSYYAIQSYRIALGNQNRSMLQYSYGLGTNDRKDPGKIPASAEIITWLYNNVLGIENEIKKCLGYYAEGNEVGRWMMNIVGIGPVFAAAMLSYFDIDRAPSVSHFYSYAGLNDNNDPWLGKEKAKALVEKYTKVFKIGYTSYELSRGLDRFAAAKGVTLVTPDGVFNNPDSNVSKKYLMEIEFDPDLWCEKGDHKKTDEVTDLELALIEQDDCHMRNMTKLLKMSWDEKKQKHLKSTLISNMAKPPYNLTLKKILYLIGESFVKVSGNHNSLYGRLYRERKAQLQAKNLEGGFAEYADVCLKKKNWGKNTECRKAYESGKLPDIQIHRMATRHAQKVFVSHLFSEMYIVRWNAVPPRTYPEVYKEHNDIVGPEIPYTAIDSSKPSGRPTNPVTIY